MFFSHRFQLQDFASTVFQQQTMGIADGNCVFLKKWDLSCDVYLYYGVMWGYRMRLYWLEHQNKRALCRKKRGIFWLSFRHIRRIEAAALFCRYEMGICHWRKDGFFLPKFRGIWTKIWKAVRFTCRFTVTKLNICLKLVIERVWSRWNAEINLHHICIFFGNCYGQVMTRLGRWGHDGFPEVLHGPFVKAGAPFDFSGISQDLWVSEFLGFPGFRVDGRWKYIIYISSIFEKYGHFSGEIFVNMGRLSMKIP